MNKKILNNTIFIIIFLFFNAIYADCGSFKIREDYFADNLIGFYLNSIDINTGDSSVEYFRYRIIQENNQTDILLHEVLPKILVVAHDYKNHSPYIYV